MTKALRAAADGTTDLRVTIKTTNDPITTTVRVRGRAEEHNTLLTMLRDRGLTTMLGIRRGSIKDTQNTTTAVTRVTTMVLLSMVPIHSTECMLLMHKDIIRPDMEDMMPCRLDRVIIQATR